MRRNVFKHTDILIFSKRKGGDVHISSVLESGNNVFGFIKYSTNHKNFWKFLFSEKIVGQSWRRS